ncbi:MAG TPA: hypothetical protein VFW22_16390 [Pseudolabrys sp.]|nr:hypothetical protein [Pseudolabrys sp.]
MATTPRTPATGPNQLTRRGKVVYETNPSVVERFPVRLSPTKLKGSAKAYMVAPGTGEVLAEGSFGFVEEKEVDSEQFVKVYLDGIRQYGQLSKAGALIFELVYREISGAAAKDRDTVALNYYIASRWKEDLAQRTFERGLSELLNKGFLFRSVASDTYFVNVRFMFNGDRIALIKTYQRKQSRKVSENQGELPLLVDLSEASET